MEKIVKSKPLPYSPYLPYVYFQAIHKSTSFEEEHTETLLFSRNYIGGSVLMETNPMGCFRLHRQPNGGDMQDLLQNFLTLKSS